MAGNPTHGSRTTVDDESQARVAEALGVVLRQLQAGDVDAATAFAHNVRETWRAVYGDNLAEILYFTLHSLTMETAEETEYKRRFLQSGLAEVAGVLRGDAARLRQGTRTKAVAGQAKYVPAPCARCKGTGKVATLLLPYNLLGVCDGCRGSGAALVRHPPTACSSCGGSGWNGVVKCIWCQGCGWQGRRRMGFIRWKRVAGYLILVGVALLLAWWRTR